MPIHTVGVSFFSENDLKRFEEVNRDGSSCNKLCISKILAKCIKARQLKSENVDADVLTARTLCSNDINADHICANSMNVNERFCVSALSAPVVCAEQLNATNICSNGLVQANVFQ